MRKVNTRKASVKSGFTMIEVSLAMAFVAALLVSIALIISSILSVFQKGLTIKSINSVGRSLMSEFTTTINAAPSVDSTNLCNVYVTSDDADGNNKKECLRDGAFNYVFQERIGPSTDSATGETVTVQYFGLLCTGKYSYAWNTYYGVKERKTLRLNYQTSSGDVTRDYDDPGDEDTAFRLMRFEDKTYRACTQNVNASYHLKDSFTTNEAHPVIDMTELANGVQITIPTPQEGFLESSESDTNLDLYELAIFPISQDAVTLRAFFSGTFILATNNGSANIVRSGDYCDPASTGIETSGSMMDLGSGFNYCGINKFNFAARTAGSGV